MTLNLIELIKASGGTAAIYQSFRNNVTGAGNGVSLRSYLLGSPVTYSGTPAPETTYASGTTFNITVEFSGYGSNFFNIRNGVSSWAFYGTANQTLNSVTWNDVTGVATLNTTVLGDYDSSTLQTFTGWQLSFNNPNWSSSVAAEQVNLTPITAGSGTASGSTTRTLTWTYDPDIASFNPSVTTNTFNVTVNRIAYPSWSTTYEWELHSDSGYTNLIGANGYNFLSNTNDENVVVGYARYRIRAAYNGGTPGAWTNYGVITWTDPRANI